MDHLEDAGELDVRRLGTWIESRNWSELVGAGTASQIDRPAQWSEDEIFERLTTALRELGLAGGRVGTDLRLAPRWISPRLESVAPGATWVDLTGPLFELRSVKSPMEIAVIREGVRVQEIALRAVLDAFAPGVTRRGLDLAFASAVVANAAPDAPPPESWMLSTLTLRGTRVGVAEASTVLKTDCGVRIGGYTTDGGRTACLAPVPQGVADAHRILAAGHAVGRSAIRPGVRACDVFAAMESAIRGSGVHGYSRGHYGHSVGVSGFTEEPPFIAAADETVLRTGMVLAIETPLYAGDLGAFQIEDLVLVTADGSEVLNELPHDLTVVD
jgi:Xaa-Pro aminopeptidase